MSHKRVTQKEVLKGMRAEGWHLDFHNKAFELRSAGVLGGAMSIRESRHTHIRESEFTVTGYTGDPKAYWKSESFETLKLAVQNANERAPAVLEAYAADG